MCAVPLLARTASGCCERNGGRGVAGDFGVQEFRVAVVLVAELEITGHPLQRGGLLPEVPPVAEREPVRIVSSGNSG